MLIHQQLPKAQWRHFCSCRDATVAVQDSRHQICISSRSKNYPRCLVKTPNWRKTWRHYIETEQSRLWCKWCSSQCVSQHCGWIISFRLCSIHIWQSHLLLLSSRSSLRDLPGTRGWFYTCCQKSISNKNCQTNWSNLQNWNRVLSILVWI